jgi:hypothetical protein
MKFTRILVLGAALLAAGCATYTAIDAGKSISVGNNVTVVPQIAWAQVNNPTVSGTVWTADGVALDALMFVTGIKPGAPLIKITGVGKDEVRLYQTGMVPDDVMELLASNLGKLGYQQIATTNLRPAPFGAREGFRFDLTYVTPDGLEMKGMAIFAQRGGVLDLILCSAPNEYYFRRYSGTVEQIFASIQAS